MCDLSPNICDNAQAGVEQDYFNRKNGEKNIFLKNFVKGLQTKKNYERKIIIMEISTEYTINIKHTDIWCHQRMIIMLKVEHNRDFTKWHISMR